MKHGWHNGDVAHVAPAHIEQNILDWASQNDLDSLRMQNHHDITRACDKNGSTALHYAAGSGALETCTFLLSTPGATADQTYLVNPLVPSSNNGRTALHWAARNGHTDVCRLLVTGCSSPSVCTIPVDVLAKGEVTPLQLAIWQAHLETARVLVHELGADPHFVNAWGCGVPHWLAKCPLYNLWQVSRESKLTSASGQANHGVEKEGQDIRNRLHACCRWLFEDCQVKTWNQPNNHGQTPLHKAAYDGNAPLVEYLVTQYGIMDDQRDHQGNTAADCAERSPNYDPKTLGVAHWLRRHASPLRIQALCTMGLLRCDDNKGSDHKDVTPSTKSCSVIAMPRLEELRSTYHRLARENHPDRRQRVFIQSKEEMQRTIEKGKEQWNAIQDAYQLLTAWWQAPPLVYDIQIRYLARNAALRDYPPILWHREWHEQVQQRAKERLEAQNQDPLLDQPRNGSNQNTQENKRRKSNRSFSPIQQAALEEFERRLISLLLTDAHRNQGLALAQLPKEYSKNFGTAPLIAEIEGGSTETMTKPALIIQKKKLPKKSKEHGLPLNPKDYRCRKLTHLLLQHCPNLHVDMGKDQDGNQTKQPRVYAKMVFVDRRQE